MEAIAIDFRRGELFQTTGCVVEVKDGKFAVETDEGLLWAARAVSCLVAHTRKLPWSPPWHRRQRRRRCKARAALTAPGNLTTVKLTVTIHCLNGHHGSMVPKAVRLEAQHRSIIV